MRGRAWAATAAAVVALVLAGCGSGDGGGVLAVPSTTGGAGGSSAPPAPLAITSPDFADGRPIPARFTCDGKDVPPTLRWDGVPAGAAELVLVVQDPDAPHGTFVHWVVFRLPPAATTIGAQDLPVEAVEGANGFGKVGYGGPCPPKGDEPHHYQFTLVAVSRRLDLPGGASIGEVRAALETGVMAQATLTGTYGR